MQVTSSLIDTGHQIICSVKSWSGPRDWRTLFGVRTTDEQLAEKMYKITKEYAIRCNLYRAVKVQ